MSNHQTTSCSTEENLQSKSNLPSKPILPPKPKFRVYAPKIKVAPRPGEAKNNASNLLAGSSVSNSQQSISTNSSNENTSSETLSLDKASKEISSNNAIVNSSVQERSVKIDDIIINDKSNQHDNHNNIDQIPEKNASISSSQPVIIDSSNKQQNLALKEINSSNDNNTDIHSHTIHDDSQSLYHFPPISVPPPPFKAKQFKYPSGSLTGTNDFPDFDRKLDEMLRLSQAPRLRGIKKNF